MPKNNERFPVSLDIENIGPHTGNNSIHFEQNITSNKLAIYAPNGTGKTFISRAFRLASPDADLNDGTKFISFGHESATFKFTIDSSKYLDLKLQVQIEHS